MEELKKAAETALSLLEHNYFDKENRAIQALRQALANLALEEMVAENQRLGLYDDQPEQEPVAIISRNKASIVGIKMPYSNIGTDDWIKLYAKPPKREWVGLTDEEIKWSWENSNDWSIGPMAFYKNIEAKLKEKNT